MIYILENDYLKAYISDLGATLTKFIDKKTNKDLVLGFETEEDYLKYSGTNIGASIGRNSNRIGNAKITLNGKEYQLSVNDSVNQLHGGGVNGFAFKRWNKVSETKEELKLAYFSKDKEEGFPGNLNVEVTYKLDKNNLIWSYSGKADQDTILNMTNHSYFNLGEDSILNLSLRLHSKKYSPIDENSLTKNEVVDASNTPYDFSEFTLLKENLDKLPCGIDNNYVWEYMGDKLMAEIKSDHIQLNVHSDLPDMHLYTAYYLNGEIGKDNKVYKPYDGICFESQFYPNGINYGKYILPILKKDGVMSHYIRYEVNNF